MQQTYQQSLALLAEHPRLFSLLSLCLLLVVAWASNWIIKRILLRAVRRALSAAWLWQSPEMQRFPIIRRLANVLPVLVVHLGIELVPNLPETFTHLVHILCNSLIVLCLALAGSGFLTLINLLYERRPEAQTRPIKGYIQLGKIVLYAITAVLVIAILLDRSPLILLSGLGAMAAVLMLIFQDTLLSLVASVQISSNDIIRVGDWVEMPSLNADGDVIDIALHAVKIQNWDKTISTIPTRRFVTDSFKNWRGMSESGGRRIKRCLYLDQTSVQFLDDEQVQRLHRLRLLGDYLSHKQSELHEWNEKLEQYAEVPANLRRLTNLGTFRAYVEHYLRNHPGIHQGMTLLVRQLSPSEAGLPLELYCFTNTTSWNAYEAIQSDIFDHLLAIVPEFYLRVFQKPSGSDLRKLTPAPEIASAAS
ncbi:mechanosensitive ion channel protein MscS [Ventosimonas gracilis]|uniref:Mechanosensitive ion channel protein MscS n=1 Tax=Ventosimonas gracilis TaxID=1680762 RepID=A0A139SPN5_9GAMM|nr:mechanosensitive ion channel family protein [Ventosimonas gracilis]KXU36440.1 mechanosensitive ion channel protein MscS [Ventosimonas gracilis]